MPLCEERNNSPDTILLPEHDLSCSFTCGWCELIMACMPPVVAIRHRFVCDHNISHLVVCVCDAVCALLGSAWPALCVFLTEIAKMDAFVHRLFSVIAVSCKLPFECWTTRFACTALRLGPLWILVFVFSFISARVWLESQGAACA